MRIAALSNDPRVMQINRNVMTSVLWTLSYIGHFVIWLSVYGKYLLALRPNPKLEEYPLSAVHGFLFNIFAVVLHIWTPFLHLQSEKAPRRGESSDFCLAVYYSKMQILRYTEL